MYCKWYEIIFESTKFQNPTEGPAFIVCVTVVFSSHTTKGTKWYICSSSDIQIWHLIILRNERMHVSSS